MVEMNKLVQIFLTGFLQVSLISVNTYLISRGLILPACFVGFFISLIWTFNVTKVALGDLKSKLSYCLGATTGTAFGLTIIKLILGGM